ncbi:MAG: TlpA family protein disulfide reductase, partial [Bacteroidaceae bacterium]|nr:TlpA family protein disulfide reductase [Bacteroidaceae bacterium]
RYTLLPNSNQYVSCLFKGDGSLFTLSNSLLQPTCRFGDSPVGDSLTWYAMRNDLNGYMAASGRTFFYAAENLPYMAAYRLQSGTMQKQWECFYRTPHYKISNDAIRYDKEKATGPLKSLSADEHYVYLLYVDTLMSRYNANDITKSCSNKVLVFDHSGEYVSTLHLNCYLKKIAVGKNGKLYGIARMPEHVLVEFDLPAQLIGGKSTKRHAVKNTELQQQVGPLEIGDTIPYIALYDTLGNTHYLQDFKGKYLLLDFWGAHCGPCKLSIPELKAIAETMSDKLEVVSISIDAKSTWKQSSIEHGICWHNLNDLRGREYDAISILYDVIGYPTFFIISPEGVILDKMKGYSEGVVTYWLKMNMN